MKSSAEILQGIFLRSGFNYDRDRASRETGLACKDPTRTIQSQAEEADINTIVKRFGVTGVLPTGVRAPVFGDFEDAFDFQSAQDALVQARESFMSMPADVRARFHNDPGEFVDFCSDKENLPEMRKLGLAVPEEPPPAAAAVVTAP